MASNIHQEFFYISRKQKESLNGHPAFTVWLTGLSASGKSTVGRLLEERLHQISVRTLVLDGDNTRLGINKDLDFSPEGRRENIRRIAEISKLLNDAGVVVIACFIAPMTADRQMARTIIGEGSFLEVFIDAPLATCIHRDPKGLYKKAMAGEIPDFTGINAPYEPPETPALKISTNDTSAEVSAGLLFEWLLLNHLR